MLALSLYKTYPVEYLLRIESVCPLVSYQTVMYCSKLTIIEITLIKLSRSQKEMITKRKKRLAGKRRQRSKRDKKRWEQRELLECIIYVWNGQRTILTNEMYVFVVVTESHKNALKMLSEILPYRIMLRSNVYHPAMLNISPQTFCCWQLSLSIYLTPHIEMEEYSDAIICARICSLSLFFLCYPSIIFH